ncbi:MAG: malto-oligosyltrehalose synthase [Candidatus Omnitrophota bacterium]
MRVPRATYRIQFSPQFGFDDADSIVGYLSDLGISDVYASPITRPRPGSPHGYDVVDPNSLNPELGTEEDFEKLACHVKDRDMGWLQDIVPNHMAYHFANGMLMDIFEKRERSAYFHFFDIDWVHPYESYQGRVLAPFLGKFYSEALEDGEIRLEFQPDGLKVRYYELAFPLFLKTYKDFFLHGIDSLQQKLGEQDERLIRYLSAVEFLDSLLKDDKARVDPGRVDQAKQSLRQCCENDPQIREFVESNLRFFNGEQDRQAGLDAFDDLLSEQCFRLSYWKVASREINYRRFFTINDLISLRAEQPEVFDHTHSLLLKLRQENKIQGVRIDHIDGLYDPAAYLHRLRKTLGDTYIITEKILADGEPLPANWDIQGTTGYDALNQISGLFRQKENATEMFKTYYKFSRLNVSLDDMICDKKRLIIGKHMAGDIDNLGYLMKRAASRDRYGRDITLYGLERALVELITVFPVYRTYIRPGNLSESDRKYVLEALTKARDKAPALEHEFRFIERFLFLDVFESLNQEERGIFWHFIMRFQQLTSPVMAKGFEDTVFYTYNKLLSLNEVGGEPEKFALALDDFHAVQEKRMEEIPDSMIASATHDTKRGEDVRARINVLSEIPQEWRTRVSGWRKMNRRKKKRVAGASYPDANDEYFIYQTLIGTYPFSPEEDYSQRIKDYVLKAVREAKAHTAWVNPDQEYEDACLTFIDRLLDQAEDNAFLADFETLQSRIAFHGLFNSLSQTILKMTVPGVPDFYQGCELWDLNLVDPDNRRPVDYDKRRRYLQDLKSREPSAEYIYELLSNPEDGRIKQYAVYHILQDRKAADQVYRHGEYLPLEVTGAHKDCVIAFARRQQDRWRVIAVPRFLTRITEEGQLPLGMESWHDTAVIFPADAPPLWRDCVSGQICNTEREVPVGKIFECFPGAVLSNSTEERDHGTER